jgi:hypothetical protein
MAKWKTSLQQKLAVGKHKFNDTLRDKAAAIKERAHTPATEPPAEPKIGDRMADGTIYAGISPRTNKPMYAMPADAPLTMTFNEATKYAANLDAYGHRDWRVPSKTELNELFKNRTVIGGFNSTGSVPAGWYLSSSQKKLNSTVWSQRFSDGFPSATAKDVPFSLRCVR